MNDPHDHDETGNPIVTEDPELGVSQHAMPEKSHMGPLTVRVEGECVDICLPTGEPIAFVYNNPGLPDNALVRMSRARLLARSWEHVRELAEAKRLLRDALAYFDDTIRVCGDGPGLVRLRKLRQRIAAVLECKPEIETGEAKP